MLNCFTTQDPIKVGLNWYAYANNNPLKFVDPTGLWTIEAQLALGPGIQVKVGKNEGVFTFGFNVGFGIAAGFYFDKNTEDMSDTKLGTKLTVKEEAKISKGIDPKFGEVSLSAKFEATVNPDLSIENTSEASLEVTDNMTRIKGEMKIETGKEGLQTDHYADTEVSLGIDVGVFAGVGIETNIETSASKDD